MNLKRTVEKSLVDGARKEEKSHREAVWKVQHREREKKRRNLASIKCNEHDRVILLNGAAKYS
jgi:hypothetical protein